MPYSGTSLTAAITLRRGRICCPQKLTYRQIIDLKELESQVYSRGQKARGELHYVISQYAVKLGGFPLWISCSRLCGK